MDMDMIALLEQAVFWHWWVLALVLIILEITVFGAFFLLWPGVAAAVVGVVLLVMPDMDWPMQFVIWAILSLASVVVWRVYRKNNPAAKSDEPHLNRRGAQYVGRSFTLEEPVINGQGKIRVDDSMWKIESQEDFEIGTKVKVTSVEGTTLQVEDSK